MKRVADRVANALLPSGAILKRPAGSLRRRSHLASGLQFAQRGKPVNRRTPPTDAEFRATLSTFEDGYRKCLAGLLSLKAGQVKGRANVELLQNFQPRLYQALLKASREYNRIGAARRELVGRKDSVNNAWFNHRQRTLAGRQATLVRAMRVGRSLGDAFLWFFYRDDQALLKQHLAQPAPSPPPTGVGGDGELALVDGVRRFGDKYILFHGISSLFRLGDASLYDFKKRRIVGIGELKTTRISDHKLEMRFVAILSPEVAAEFAAKRPIAKAAASHLTADQNRRLKRQLSRISKASHQAEEPAQRVEFRMPAMGYAGELSDLVRSAKTGRPACRKLGPGLLAIAIRPPKASLASRLAGQGRSVGPGVLPTDLAERAIDLMLAGSSYNCLLVNSVLYGPDWEPIPTPGTTPILWWPIETSVMRDMMLGDCMVVTVYNPAHLIASLYAKGLSVERFAPPSDFAFSFAEGKRRCHIEDAAYFLRLVAVSLLREDYVAELLRLSVGRLEVPPEVPEGTNVRFDLLFMHDMLGVMHDRRESSSETKDDPDDSGEAH